MKANHKFNSSVVGILLFAILSTSAFAQVGIGTSTPGDGAMLDIESTDKAILIPKVHISNLSTISPIVVSVAAEESLLVYNTNSATGKGFHYWDGLEWILVGVNVAGGNDWSLTGNAGMTLSDPPLVTDNFLGTIDDQDYIFRTNGVERMRLTYETISGDARLGIGTDTPNETLDVNGDMEMGGGIVRFDNQGENIKISPDHNTWYLSVRNEPLVADSDFFIGDSASDGSAEMAIDPITEYVLFGNDGNPPDIEDILHVLDDQEATTAIRIDNDNSGTAGTVHSSFELWEGVTEAAFFRHKNVEDVLEIGHALTTGSVKFTLGGIELMNFVNGNVEVSDDLYVSGTLSKGGGTFKIDHPLDPENKYLYHSFVESPDMMNIYNGNITTDKNGVATITLPSYFNALNKQFQYLFTPIGTFSKVMVTEEISENTFTIKSEQPNVKVSWQVTGIRQDPYANMNRVIPEVDKETKDVSNSRINTSHK
jgi:hypothetical protein